MPFFFKRCLGTPQLTAVNYYKFFDNFCGLEKAFKLSADTSQAEHFAETFLGQVNGGLA